MKNQFSGRRNDPQFFSEVLKCPFRKWLGEYICYLLLCLNIFQLDVLFCDLFTKKVIFDRDVLCLGMHDRILGDADGTCVVA